MNKILKYFKRRFLCINGQGDREMINVSQFSPRVTRSKSKQQQQQQQQQQPQQNSDGGGNCQKKKSVEECSKKGKNSGKSKGKKQNSTTGEVNSVLATRGSLGSYSLVQTPNKLPPDGDHVRKANFGPLLTAPSPRDGSGLPRSSSSEKSVRLRSPKIATVSADTPERNAHFYKNIANISDCRLRILGKGSFGTIIQATYKGELVAAKIVPPQKVKTLKNELNNFLLSHPNIVKTLRIISNEDSYTYGLVIMEMCSSSNLEHLAQENSDALTDRSIVRFMIDIGHALGYCHSQRVLHLDVKPKNILVNTKTNVCKLCDFGSSCLLMEDGDGDESGEHKTLQSTVVYTSPELLTGGSPTDKSDVYSFGITLWQLVHREKPYVVDEKIDLQSTIYKIVKQKERPQIKGDPNKVMEDLYVRCWHHEPDQRPSMEEVTQYLEKVHDS